MIVTLTANPSLDRTIVLAAALARGEVQRAVSVRQEPGGKGVNVSRALRASDLETLAILPGTADDPMVIALHAEGIESRSVPIGGAIRSNVSLIEADGVTTKVNEPGPTLSPDEVNELIVTVADAAANAEWLVLAGSLPPGVSSDFYSRVIRAVRARSHGNGPLIAVDSSGEPLFALMSELALTGERIDLIKPNAEELAELTGSGDESSLEKNPEEAARLSFALLERGVNAVLATLGSRGAVLVTAEGAWFGQAPTIVARSTVGAGDSSLAGYLLATLSSLSPAERLAQAVAHGAAAASLPGSTMPSVHQTLPGDIVVSPLSRTVAERV